MDDLETTRRNQRRALLKMDTKSQQIYADTVARQTANLQNPMMFRTMVDALGTEKNPPVFTNYQPPTPRQFDTAPLTDYEQYRDERFIAEETGARKRYMRDFKEVRDKVNNRMLNLQLGNDTEPAMTDWTKERAVNTVTTSVWLRKIHSRMTPEDQRRLNARQINYEDLAKKYGITK